MKLVYEGVNKVAGLVSGSRQDTRCMEMSVNSGQGMVGIYEATAVFLAKNHISG
jgi:hypothetical protein